MAEKKEGKMLSFPEIKDFVEYWCDIRGVELREVHKSIFIDKDPQDTVKPVVLNGIGFKIWMLDGQGRMRQTNRKLMAQMCSDESTTTDNTISIAQARGACLNWLNDKASELISDQEFNKMLSKDGVEYVNIFDAEYTEIEDPKLLK